jgi:DNA invertase Pin-like site-specific DNA recombinase
MNTHIDIIGEERFEIFVAEAARMADYQSGFGIPECDLVNVQWWAAYTRQSTREQTDNDRLGEYLLSCARLAKQHDAVVPREYIIYDVKSSEDFDRPGIQWLLNDLIKQRKISGLVAPSQGRISADPLHQLTLERICHYYGVQLICGDAPIGEDWGSQTTRMLQAQANLLRIKTNRENALGGNIARVMTGKVPAHRAPYGYILKTEKIIDERNGRTKVLSACWVIDQLDSEGNIVIHSPAWVVQTIFIWMGEQGRTAYWVANKLNELNIPPPQRETWMPRTVLKIANRKCYTGKAAYNVNGRVPNPDRPLGDLTMGIKRTLIRPKPESEIAPFEVPLLTTEHLWMMTNRNIKDRGRGRGKQGRSIQALFRTRMLCPRCHKPMSVMHKKDKDQVYYYCRAHLCSWIKNPCTYTKFIPATWDGDIWQEICQLLKNDDWLESQLKEESSRFQDNRRLMQIEEHKIHQARQRLSKIQDGWENGLYTAEETKRKLTEMRARLALAEQEINTLSSHYTSHDIDTVALRTELMVLRHNSIKNASFEDRLELVSRLGIKIEPAEDLKSRRIKCCLNPQDLGLKGGDNSGFAKVTFGGAEVSIGRTLSVSFCL